MPCERGSEKKLKWKRKTSLPDGRGKRNLLGERGGHNKIGVATEGGLV